MTTSFESDMLRLGGAEAAALAGGVKITLFGCDLAVIEGHRGVRKLSAESVGFSVGKKGTLRITGGGLRIIHLSDGLAVVGGKISGVDFV